MMLGVANSTGLNMSLTGFLDFATGLKVGLVEIKMDEPHLLSALSKTKQRRAIRDIVESFNFKYSVHAPYIDINLASMNSVLRKASEKTILRSLEFATNIDAKLVVSHVGRLSRDYPKEMVTQSLKNVISCLRNLANFSKNHGIIFSIENDHKSNDQILAGYPEQLMFLIEKVGCKFTLDVGHANTLARIETFMDMLAEHIVNVHLHDNNGEQDAHLSLGKGKINFSAVLESLGKTEYKGPLVVEVHSSSGLEESVTLLRKTLGKRIDSSGNQHSLRV
ncbi:sugar phosphate isomerase/epimerase [Candidatus Bathyarchaeota archaeon]|nr:MAG: sugar phosphate isomerase/epimerase [Candidatus Bathyarchaeota archaeon]